MVLCAKKKDVQRARATEGSRFSWKGLQMPQSLGKQNPSILFAGQNLQYLYGPLYLKRAYLDLGGTGSRYTNSYWSVASSIGKTRNCFRWNFDVVWIEMLHDFSPRTLWKGPQNKNSTTKSKHTMRAVGARSSIFKPTCSTISTTTVANRPVEFGCCRSSFGWTKIRGHNWPSTLRTELSVQLLCVFLVTHQF